MVPPPLAGSSAADEGKCNHDSHSSSTTTKRALTTVVHHLKKHVGLNQASFVGLVCAVAYFDPGNWSVDLQAGATFGFRPMLFVVLMAGIGAVVFQSMAFKLGCVTGMDLASHCRLLLYDRPKYKRLIRYGVLYPLYVLCEVAIVSTDLAELLGSAIGLVLLIPSLPIWAALLLTATDVLIFLLIGDPSRNGSRRARLFESVVIILVGLVFIGFIILLVGVHVNWGQAFMGFIPSAGLFQTEPNAIYTAVGILGATVMPHALFLGSHLATQDRVSTAPAPIPLPAGAETMPRRKRAIAYLKSFFTASRFERIAEDRQHRNQFARPESNTYEFVQAHLRHGLVDIVTSLLCVAVPINSAILVIAAVVFFPNPMSHAGNEVGLFEAHEIIQTRVGPAFGVIFAVALLCAGQTASITATLAGQIVSEGFIEWRVSPVMRRIITRLIGLIPSLIVATAVGRQGIDALLVISQVVLSVVLPFVVLPLVYLASNSEIMAVNRPMPSTPPVPEDTSDAEKSSISTTPSTLAPRISRDLDLFVSFVNSADMAEEVFRDECSEITADGVGWLGETSSVDPQSPADIASVAVADSDLTEVMDYSNGLLMKGFGYFFWVIIVVANAYALVELALGNTT
ncbi:Nramp-domain-containing protein [Peniophora sp. CONT]|nr:Nramp-domain-containing protein [Peniophora sp. CONT]